MVNKNLLFKPLAILFLSIILFRGRLGADDLEVFQYTIFLFKNLNLSNIHELINNFTFEHRLVWVIIDFVLISLFYPILEILFEEKISIFIMKFICGVQISLFSVISFFILYKYFKKKIFDSAALFLTSLFFLGTPVIVLLTGSYIESLIILLIIILFSTKNINIKSLIIIIIFFIKPYYLLITLISLIKNKTSYKAVIKRIIQILLYILILKYFFSIFQTSSYIDRFPINFDNVFKNFLLILMSPSFGFIFSYPLMIYLIIFSKIKKNKLFIFKIFGLISLILFLSLFEWWHGQTPSSRYLIPAIFIFIDEFRIGLKSILKNKNKKIFLNLSFLLICLNLSTLEFRNTSIYDYHKDAYGTGKANGHFESDNDYYDYYNFENHHIIFANKVLYSKIFHKQLNYSGFEINYNNFFPQSLVSRIVYILYNPRDNYLILGLDKLKNIKVLLLISILLSYFLIVLSIYRSILKINEK
jgi:hypothetical protein